MGKPIATMSCTLVCDNPTAQATILTPPSVKVMANKQACYFGVLQVQVMGAMMGTIVQNAPMVGTITGTGMKVMSNKQPAVVMGDKTTAPVICPAIDNSSGAPATIPVNVTIMNAGQVKVMAS